MQAARRLYLYVMSGITLAVVAGGLVVLLRVLLADAFPEPEFGRFDDPRQQLSQAIAMLGVGLPVWASHWWLAQRGARVGRPDADAERRSAVRAAYLTLVLLVSLTLWFTSALTFGRWLAWELLSEDTGFVDVLGAVTLGAVAFAVWLHHGLARRADAAAGPVTGTAAWLPRLYVYGVAVVALFTAAATIASLLNPLLHWLDPLEANPLEPGYLVAEIGTAAAWAILWLGHWRYAGRLSAEAGWRGSEERAARVRVAAFFVVILGAAALTLGDGARALRVGIELLLRIHPYPAPWQPLGIVISAGTASVYGLLWWWHDRALRREPAAADPLRSLHQLRLIGYGLSGVTLAMGATAAGWLVGAGLDLLGGSQTELEFRRTEIGIWLALALVALPAWAWFWRRVLSRRRSDPAGEAGSTIRRTFLFLSLAVALLTVLSAATLILNRLVGVVLGARIGGDVVSELSTPVGALLVAVAVALYHGLALRADQQITAEAHDAGATPETAPITAAQADVATGAPDTAARRSILLVGPPGADVDAALAAVRSALPEGFQVVDRDA